MLLRVVSQLVAGSMPRLRGILILRLCSSAPQSWSISKDGGLCITSHNLPKTDISKVSAKLEAPKGFQWNVFSITGAILTIIGALFWINISFLGVGTASENEVPSIAVLPFENKGAKEDDFYAYGISSDLISDVTSTGMIRVAGLNDIEKLDYSSMSYKDLSDKLLVRYVAKGTLENGYDVSAVDGAV